MGNCSVESSHARLTVEASGTLLLADVLAIIEEWYPKLTAAQILWDLSKADLSQLTMEDYNQIATVARSKLPAREHSKTAYVVADSKAYVSLWRYVQRAAAMRVGPEYSAFTDRARAETWLKQL